MKAVILAAGIGSRIGFKDIPKPMYKINGKPILEHNVLLLKNSGIQDICITLHYLPDVIKNYFQDGNKWSVNIIYSYEEKLLGTSGALKNIKWDWGYDPFCVIYGDNYTNVDLTSMLQIHKKNKPVATIALFDPKQVKNSSIAGGIVKINKDNRLISFEEGKSKQGYVNAGVYILEPAILDMIPTGKVSDFGKDIFPELLKKGHLLMGYLTSGFVLAIDSQEALEIAECHIKEGMI